MTGPCLCGDPACASCFPSGQTRMVCLACEWDGHRYECGYDEATEEDTCPLCNSDVSEAQDQGYGHGV